MSRIKYALLVLAIIGITGCGEKATETAEQQQAEAAEEAAMQLGVPEEAQQVTAPARQAPAKKASQNPLDVTEAIKESPPPPPPPPPAPAPPVREAVEQQAAPQAQEARSITIPAGTAILVRLQDALDSGVNKSGDTFRAILDEDIDVNGNLVAPKGSLLEGKLSNVAQSGRTKGRATMSLQLVSIEVGNQSYPLQTKVLEFIAESTKKEDATKVGIGAGIGAVIGAIAGGGKGAAIGAAVGGGAGGATVLATRGKEIKFDVEQQFSFETSEDVGVRLN